MRSVSIIISIFTIISSSLFGQVTTDTSEAFRLSRLGFAIYAENTEEANSYFQESVSVLRQNMQTRRDSVALEKQNETIGEFLQKRGGFALASTYHEDGLQLAEVLYANTRFFVVIGHYSYNLGHCYAEMGLATDAIRLFQKAIPIYERRYKELDKNVAVCYSALATAYQETLNFSTSILYFNKALRIYKELYGRESVGVAIVHNNLGVLHSKLSEYQLAQKNFKEAIAIYDFLLDKVHKSDREIIEYRAALVQTNLAELYLISNQDEAAYETLLSIIAFNNKGNRTTPALNNIYLSLAHYHKGQGNEDSSIYYIDKSIEVYTQIYGAKHPKIGNSYKLLGNLYQNKQDYINALESYQKALIAMKKDFNNTDIFQNPSVENEPNIYLLPVLSDKANALELLYNVGQDINYLKLAYNTYLPIDKLVTTLRRDITVNKNHLQISKHAERHFKNAIHLCYKLLKITGEEEYKHKLFYFSNKVKSESLASILSNLEAKEISGIPEELLVEERRLKVAITYYETEMEKVIDDNSQLNRFKFCVDTLFSLKNEYDNLIANFETAYPRYYELKHFSKNTNADELQELLDSKTAILDYSYTSTHLYISVVTATGFEVVAREIPSNFVELLVDFHQLLQKRTLIQKDNTKKFATWSADLREILIGTVEDYIADYEKLIIFPEGALHYLPFEVLITNADATTYSEMNYLIKDFEISYHYSAYLLASRLRSRFYRHDKKLLALAPVFDSPQDEQQLVANLKSVPINDGNRSSFGPLMWSEKEVQEISTMYDNSASIIYYRKEASENNFKEAVDKAYYDNIHISTHGLANTINPDYSWLAFALGIPGEDGFLHSGEIYNLRLNSNLVVLSSCESGLGQLSAGEGMISLNRGFLYAGANNVVYSLWKVNDKYTYQLMTKFYKYINEGQTYAAALRNAKLSLIEGDSLMTKLPTHWSSFLLLGR